MAFLCVVIASNFIIHPLFSLPFSFKNLWILSRKIKMRFAARNAFL